MMSRPSTDPGRAPGSEDPQSFLPDIPRAASSNSSRQPQPPESGPGPIRRGRNTPSLAFAPTDAKENEPSLPHDSATARPHDESKAVHRLTDMLHVMTIARDEALSKLRSSEIMSRDAQHSASVDHKIATESQARVRELETTLNATEDSWKALFNRSNDDMEAVMAQVADLESQIEEGITDSTRATSVQNMFELEKAAQQEELQRQIAANAQTKDRLERQFADSAALTRKYEETKANLDSERRAHIVDNDRLSAQIESANQALELLKHKVEQQQQSAEEAADAHKKMHEEMEQRARTIQEQENLISEANTALQMSEEKIEAQAARLRQDASELGRLMSVVKAQREEVTSAHAEKRVQLRAASDKDRDLDDRHTEISDQLKASVAASEQVQQIHQDLSAENAQLKQELKQSNGNCSDLKHEVQYLLAQLSQSRAKTIQVDELVAADTSKPVWEEATVKLGGDASMDDAIVRMKVIDWGSMGREIACQTEAEFIDPGKQLDTALQHRVHHDVGMIELEQKLREQGHLTEQSIVEIITFPFVEVGKGKLQRQEAILMEQQLRETGTFSELQIAELVSRDSPELLAQFEELQAENAATFIQSRWRGGRARSAAQQAQFDAETDAAVSIQARIRGRSDRRKALEMTAKVTFDCQTQTDVINLYEITIDPAMRDPKLRLEHELRESGKFTEIDIIQLLTTQSDDAVHTSNLSPRGFNERDPVLYNPDLLEAVDDIERVVAVDRLRSLLETAGVARSAMNEYLAQWTDDGVDDDILDAWQAGVVTSIALEEDFGVRSVGDRYKILAALKALPQGGTMALPAATSGPEPAVIGTGHPKDPEMHEEHNVLRGNFDQTRSKMHDLLTTHFEDAIREKDRLTEELATTHTSLAVLNHEHAELQKRFGFTSDELTDERHNLKVARSEINQLEAYRAELTATVARQERYAQDEAQTVSQQMTVLTSKLTAERLEKEQFKILVDKVGAEIVKEKAEDDRLMDQITQMKSKAKSEKELLEAQKMELGAEIKRQAESMSALQTSLDTKEEFARRLESEKAALLAEKDRLIKELEDMTNKNSNANVNSQNAQRKFEEDTETYQARLTEQMTQIKRLEDRVAEQQVEVRQAKDDQSRSGESFREVINEKVSMIGDLQHKLDTTESDKEKISKNCFEQMTKLNESLQKIQHMKAEYEVAMVLDEEQRVKIAQMEDNLREVTNERDHASSRLQDLANSVSRERQLYQESKAENSVYSNAVKRLELQVFQTNMQCEDNINKIKAKMRAVSAEKESISAAYLKVTERLGDTKDREIGANQKMMEAMQERDAVFNEIDALKAGKARVEGDFAAMKKQLKATEKARKKAEQNMKSANARATEMEEILASKVRQLGKKIFAFEE